MVIDTKIRGDWVILSAVSVCDYSNVSLSVSFLSFSSSLVTFNLFLDLWQMGSKAGRIAIH